MAPAAWATFSASSLRARSDSCTKTLNRAESLGTAQIGYHQMLRENLISSFECFSLGYLRGLHVLKLLRKGLPCMLHRLQVPHLQLSLFARPAQQLRRQLLPSSPQPQPRRLIQTLLPQLAMRPASHKQMSVQRKH